MATVSVSRSVTAEVAASALRDQLGGAKVELKGSNADTIRVTGNPFARAKVHVRQSGNGTSFDVSPSPYGPIGWLVSTFWYTRKVTQAIEQAPGLRGESPE